MKLKWKPRLVSVAAFGALDQIVRHGTQYTLTDAGIMSLQNSPDTTTVLGGGRRPIMLLDVFSSPLVQHCL
jgi:hypothetical protein